ncbi:hypothetical protein FB567DRAFT_593676 [Paraphoma chrysanthemicola]|uniref:Uncharacterized protein n=1 Tax=Paraphoma chrysanthemicola TaxID=798071 RepID=A0A8K0VXI8_9PLEO|nr:hypothetical protein FB567DRAFT_593676 [Paraphoma chrysanthemicola]
MSRTRKTGERAAQAQIDEPKEENSSSTESGPKKRKAGVDAVTTASTHVLTVTSDNANALKDDQEQPKKPRLTTPDVEFDFDRSQLRDPRLTPGRKTRPRYDKRDIPDDQKEHLEATRDIFKPVKPKGRLTNFVENEFFVQESRENPLKTFHQLYRCYDKDRDGSPTYDKAGFQLDYDKVAQWMNPQAYSKKKIVRNMDRAVGKAKCEEEQIFELFFETVPTDRNHMTYMVKNCLIDQVSKEMGIPWHQIKPEHVQAWRDKGFQFVKHEEWWQTPTEVEKKRMLKMMSGASLRKIL